MTPVETIQSQTAVDQAAQPVSINLSPGVKIHSVHLTDKPADTLRICTCPDPVYLNSRTGNTGQYFLDFVSARVYIPAGNKNKTELKKKKTGILNHVHGTRNYSNTINAGDTPFIKERPEASTDWIVLVIILSFTTVAWIKSYYERYLSLTIQSVTNTQASEKFYRESNVLTSRVSFVLNMVFFINLSLFIAQVLKYYHLQLFDFSDVLGYLVVFLAITIITIVKYLSYKLIGYLFMIDKIISNYIYNVFIFNKVYGLILFPIVTGIPFLPDSFRIYAIYFGLICFILMYFAQLIRGIKIFLYNNISAYYLILYLCALEILPFLVFYKFILSLL